MSQDAKERLDDVAIVGMACRTPGAASVDEFWANLLAGKESISFFDEHEIDPSVAAEIRSDPAYVRARGIVDDCDTFDAAFFGISPIEARVMDPQQRKFLEVSWEALEHAGCNKDSGALVGVFGGTGVNTYFTNNVLRRPDLLDAFGEFNVITANDKDYLTTRMSYKLGLRGPSLNVQTACSTSLVAVVQAYWSLMTYQCDVALAGGASIDVPVKAGYLYEEGGMLSADGHCRPFDANSSGTLFNSGVGVVALKRLEDAVADRDRIYAVIRGAATNNDGDDKVSFTAPSVAGQCDVICQALDQAGFLADSIGYVEAHGTATPLGDPIEIEALTKAFRRDTQKQEFCRIGSVKSNVGHLVAAAGVAGLIKTALSLYHRKIPASINFKAPNPAIDFSSSPFTVAGETVDWDSGPQPRRAGVSSFGVGGTNAHVVLEEWEQQPESEKPPLSWQLIPVSARSEDALRDLATSVGSRLEPMGDAELADAAFTLQTGRSGLAQRRFVVARDGKDAAAALAEDSPNSGGRGALKIADPGIAFLFPGQGSQHPNMCFGLYSSLPVVRRTIERCAEVLSDSTNIDLIDLLYGGDDTARAERLRQTANAQPALFAVEYAIARAWMAAGIQPSALVGHSIGEFVAACVAGVFDADDGIRLVARRGELMQQMPTGSMLSVRAAPEAVEALAQGDLCLAAINAASLCVLSGPDSAIDKARKTLEEQDIACSVLHTSHAFHSEMMDGAVEPLVEAVAKLTLREPSIPIVSTATGTWLDAQEATSPRYWGEQLRQTVKFGPAIERLSEERSWIMIESGPRRVATQLARQQVAAQKRHVILPTLGDDAGADEDVVNWLKAIGNAWIAGASPDWQELHLGSDRARCPLPTYPFRKTRHWADVDTPVQRQDMTQPATEVPLAAEPNTTVADARPADPGIENMPQQDRIPSIVGRVRTVFADTSGVEPGEIDIDIDFVEQGFDSLFLTQAATAIKKEFGQKVTFRELMEDYPDVEALARHLDQLLPQESMPVAAPQAAPEPAPTATATTASSPAIAPGVSMTSPTQSMSVAEQLIQRQLDIMQQQLEMLKPGSSAAPIDMPVTATPPQPPAVARPEPPGQQEKVAAAPRAGAKISKQADALSAAQSANLQDFVRHYNAMTRASKEFAQSHRKHFADPRTASGFRPVFKEMVYQIVMQRSCGSRLWDIDGNEYIDLLNGFGSNMLGHLPDYVCKALHEQADLGLEIGPQTAIAGEVAQLFCELSGNERMAFSNTGSEAVAGAVRMARTVTGRNLVVTFDGDYHGIFDEVLVRGSPSMKSLPSSPGVPREMVENMLVLPFNDARSIDIIREQGEEVAAVLVEFVQGGDPGNVSADWLRDLRSVTTEIDAALICDEVITGFRVHPQGAQGYFGIQADIATYGKVAGGGLPIGIIAGKAEFMDALDGGQWQFGDNSIPEVGVTYFAGTFVRHPLTMAASRAALTYMKEQGPELQQRLNTKADEFVAEMNAYFRSINAPWTFENFGSLMNLKSSWDSPFQELLYYQLRANGVHAWYGRPCFLTDAHTQEDLQLIKRAFEKSIGELVEMGFLENVKAGKPQQKKEAPVSKKPVQHEPPVNGARLGRDADGNPGWFIPDPNRPGKYLQVGE